MPDRGGAGQDGTGVRAYGRSEQSPVRARCRKAHAEAGAAQSAAKVRPGGTEPLGRCVPHKALHITVVQPCPIRHDWIAPYPS
ncbi:hypothetical protein GCM10010433_63260 [Streptomyces pulveraceus]